MTPYNDALERFASWGVDTEAALSTLAATPISLHCWQGDDVAGFESSEGAPGSGCLATGNYPGKDNPGCVPMPKKIDNRNTSYVLYFHLLPLLASNGL
jgi:L-rhamnose isomerase